jgi:hypothetical protein
MAHFKTPQANVATLGQQTTLIYALLLIPTIWLLWMAGGDDTALSKLYIDTWFARFWHFTGLTPLASLVVAHVFLYIAIGLAGMLFFQGYRFLDGFAYLTPADARELPARLLRWSGLFALILAFVIPFDSEDILGYINRGVLQAFYQLNPYVTPVGDLPHWQSDPLFHNHWVNNPSPYGFFFTWLTSLLVSVAGRNFGLSVLVFKLFNVAVFLALSGTVYRLALALKLPRPWLSLYLTSWNPLLLLHLVANGHNDGLLALLLMLALWTLIAGRWLWLCGPALALSVLTKYASILAIPFISAWLIRKGQYRPLLISIVIGAFIVWLFSQPFLAPAGQRLPLEEMADNAVLSQHSLHSALSRLVYYAGLLSAGTDAWFDPARHYFRFLLWGLYIFFYVGLVFRFIRQPIDNSRLVSAVAVSMALMITLSSSKFHSWYAGMFLPLLFLLPEGTFFRRFAIYFTGFQLLSFTPLDNLHILNFVVLTLVPYLLAWRHGREQDCGRAIPAG